MKVVIAPDSFKESLSAEHAAQALADGVRQALPDATIVCVPMGDGGEGTLDAVLAATDGERRRVRAQDALGRPHEVDWGYLPGQTAFIEMAGAAGLEAIAFDERDVGRASTFGVGEVIRAALDAGALRLVIGLGGSATNDGGAGMLQALGVRLLDAKGENVMPGGKALSELATIDLSKVDPRLSGVLIEAATDVDNPLCGPNGASAVFGPQKGAKADDVRQLDRALSHFADLTAQATGTDVRDAPGTGAAGGSGFALQAYFGARFRPGVALVAELNGLADTLHEADLVYTGEGRMDAQTVRGKTPFGVAQLARAANVPVIAVAGSLGEGYEAMYAYGLTAAFSLVGGPTTLATACAEAPRLLAERARDTSRLWAASTAQREKG
ncbi:MAG: glycerate kinase [Burkholderiaceae bacterium]|nr:glycerate kinase [Burkholderiaceae bacterium]